MSFTREPVLWTAIVSSLLSVAIGFGLHLTSEQQALVMAAVIAIVNGVVPRSKVTPVADPNLPE